MEVAFGKVDGYESFDGADFTDEIFMTKYLHKVLSICGFDFDGVALTIDGEEKSRNELKDDLSLVEPTVEEEEPRELLSTEKISALSKKAITLPFVNMGTVSPIAAPLTNKEAKKQEKLASRQEKEQEKRAQKLNKLHRPS